MSVNSSLAPAPRPSPTDQSVYVDDSALARQVLAAFLHSHPTIDVIGQAADPLFALEKMRKQCPDVRVLDVEMPRMDGITFLRKIIAERPTPSIICSTLTEAGAATGLQIGRGDRCARPGLLQVRLDAWQRTGQASEYKPYASIGAL